MSKIWVSNNVVFHKKDKYCFMG